MVDGDPKGNPASDLSSCGGMAHHHDSERTIKSVARLSKFLDHLSLNKGKTLPLAVIVIPSLFLTGGSIETSAATLTGITESVQTFSVWLKTLNDGAKEEILNPENQMKELMIFIYKWISMMIYTPAFLFENAFFKDMLRTFSGLSIAIATIVSMIEGFKRISGLSGTSLKKIAMRLPIMIGVCGFAPWGFVKAIEAMNWVTNMVFAIGNTYLNQSTAYSDMWELNLFGDVFEAIGFALFLLLYVALLIPMMLHHGRRWFSILSLGVLTPFAMLGYVFDSFKSIHNSWWNSLKGLLLVQIVYSIFVTILALLMFAVPFPGTLEGLFAKLLVLLGGLYTLAIPPPFVKKFFDNGPTPKQSYALIAKKLGMMMIKKV